MNEYKVVKADYQRITDEKLYEKWEMTESNGRTTSDCSIEYVYVTFRSMAAKEEAVKIFEFAEDDKASSKMFLDNYLTVETPTSPSQIIWANIIYSKCNRITRNIVCWLFAVAIIILAFYLMILFKDYNDGVVLGAGLFTTCPSEPIDIEVAFLDWQKPPKQRQGFTHCYCLPIYNEGGESAISASNADFQAIAANPLTEYPCEAWLWVYNNAFYLTLIMGILISVINSICVALFEMIPPMCEKSLTYREEIFLQF